MNNILRTIQQDFNTNVDGQEMRLFCVNAVHACAQTCSMMKTTCVPSSKNGTRSLAIPQIYIKH